MRTARAPEHAAGGAVEHGPGRRLRAFWTLRGFAPVRTGYTLTKDVEVPMPDGARLRADLYRPDGAPRPTVLVRTPYGRPLSHLDAVFFAARGYTVLVQASRGTDSSDGEFRPMLDEAEDGASTVAWLHEQPWFDGTFVTWGASYLAYVQLALAREHRDGWRGAMLITGPHDFGAAAYGRGPFDLLNFSGWTGMMSRRDGKSTTVRLIGRMLRDERSLRGLFTTRPLTAALTPKMASDAPWYPDWVGHTDPHDEFWSQLDHTTGLEHLDVPVLLVGGWQDLFLRQSLQQWQHLQGRGADLEVRVHQHTHLDPASTHSPVAHNRELAWLDRLFAGGRAASASPYEVYVTGAGAHWQPVEAWPPAAASPVAYHLTADGRLDRTPGAGTSVSVRYDPHDPTPSIGGHTMAGDAGVRKNGPVEAREDVLVFTSAPLAQDLDVVGVAALQVAVASTAPGLDVFVRLCDVDPKGISRNVTDEIHRLADLGDEPTPTRLELQGTAHRFAAGHRVRLQVSGGAFPRFAVHPALRAADAAPDGSRPPVRITLAPGADGALALELPVLPRG